jgi:lipoate---protein ligase
MVQEFGAHLNMNVHHGIIKSFEYASAGVANSTVEAVQSLLVGRKLQDLHSWHDLLNNKISDEHSGSEDIANCLDKLLPIPEVPEP